MAEKSVNVAFATELEHYRVPGHVELDDALETLVVVALERSGLGVLVGHTVEKLTTFLPSPDVPIRNRQRHGLLLKAPHVQSVGSI